MSYCTVVGTGIVRVLRWVVCCVFEGFLEVIVRAADHGDTLFTGHPGTRVPGYPAGYPAAGYPIRKSRRVLGRTRTRSRVLPVRVFTRVVNERVAPLPRSTVLVIKMIEAWVSGTSMKAANGGTSSSHSSNSSIAVRASQSERVAPLPRSTVLVIMINEAWVSGTSIKATNGVFMIHIHTTYLGHVPGTSSTY